MRKDFPHWLVAVIGGIVVALGAIGADRVGEGNAIVTVVCSAICGIYVFCGVKWIYWKMKNREE